MIKKFDRDPYGANTYLVWNPCADAEGRRAAMIVDAGNPPEEVAAFAERERLAVRCLVLTHGHYDHISYLPQYRAQFPEAAVICHESETAVLCDEEANVSVLFGDPIAFPETEIDRKVKEHDRLTLSGGGEAEPLSFEVLHTPGHTPGSICLFCEAEKVMLTGDTLFAEGCGRTDFKYGSARQMRDSLRRLYAMDPAIRFYPGHGEDALIGETPRLC